MSIWNRTRNRSGNDARRYLAGERTTADGTKRRKMSGPGHVLGIWRTTRGFPAVVYLSGHDTDAGSPFGSYVVTVNGHFFAEESNRTRAESAASRARRALSAGVDFDALDRTDMYRILDMSGVEDVRPPNEEGATKNHYVDMFGRGYDGEADYPSSDKFGIPGHSDEDESSDDE